MEHISFLTFLLTTANHFTVIFVGNIALLLTNSFEVVVCEIIIQQNFLNFGNFALFVFQQIFNDCQVVIEMIDGNNVLEKHIMQSGHASGSRLARIQLDILKILDTFVRRIAKQAVDNGFISVFLNRK